MLWLVVIFLTVVSIGASRADDLPSPAAGMHLTFSETFDHPLSWCSDFCNGQRWRTKYTHSGTTPQSRGLGLSGGSESEVFIDPRYLGLGINPFRIDQGTLIMSIEPASARVKSMVAASWPSWWTGKRIAPKFTAGMLSTDPSFRQLYGYFEARIKISNVPGTWPAFWLLGPEEEIDVMEALGGRPTRQHMTVLWGPVTKRQRFGKSLDTMDLSADFHTYGALWTANEIVFYFDGVEQARFPNVAIRKPMFMIISMGTDGDWNKQQGFFTPPDAHAQMMVQYVKAYQQ